MRTFLITVQTEKELPELVDTIANRIYVIDGVKDVGVEELAEYDDSLIDSD